MTTPQVHPERQARVRKALKYFSVAAWITGIWLLVLVTRMVLDYGFHMEIPTWAKFIGQVHGFFYMAYLIATVNLGINARWEPTKWITTALAGTIPFLSFVAEANRRKEVTAQFHL